KNFYEADREIKNDFRGISASGIPAGVNFLKKYLKITTPHFWLNSQKCPKMFTIYSLLHIALCYYKCEYLSWFDKYSYSEKSVLLSRRYKDEMVGNVYVSLHI